MQAEKHQPDYILYFTVVILTGIGILTVYSASSVLALHHGLPATYYAIRQLISAVIGLAAMTALMHIPYQRLYRWAPLMMIANVVLLCAVLVPGIGKVVNGGRRWIGSSSLHIQPSELAIVFTAMYLAFFFTKKVTVLHSFKRGFRPAIVIIVVNFLLILKEPDMGTGLTLLGMSMAVVFASGIPLKQLFALLAVAVPSIIGLAFAESYRSSRMMVFLHLFQHKDTAYQILQGLTAITRGGWFGRGFDLSLEKTGYLPEPHTDFIFAVFSEEWGVVGDFTLIFIFGFIVWRSFKIVRSASNRFGALLSVGLIGMITIKAIINLGAVTALLPVTGIPLPFVSYGGTSIIVNLAAMGVLLSVSKHTLDEEPEADQLADVVPVEEAMEQRTTGQASAFAREALTPQQKPKTAVVQPLRPRAVREQKSTSSWRTRQEVAAAKHTSDRRAAPSSTSWRARNQQMDPWNSQSKQTKGKDKSRRDR